MKEYNIRIEGVAPLIGKIEIRRMRKEKKTKEKQNA